MAVTASPLLSLWAASSIWSITAVVLASAWIIYRIKYNRYIKLGNKIPGPPSLPLIGNAHEALRARSHDHIFEVIWKLAPEYPQGIGRVWFGPRLIVGIWNPQDIEIILSSSVHLEKSPEYRYFQPWLGDGLLISSGEKWKAHRKLIAPTFHLSVLKTFISLFNANSRVTVDRMRKELGKEFDAHDYMVETTVEILLETAMGVNKKTQENAYNYGSAVMNMCDIMHYRHFRLWLRSDFTFGFTKYAKIQERLLDTIHTLTKKVITEKRIEERTGKKSVVVQKEVPDVETVSSATTTQDETVSFGKNVMIKDDLDEDMGEKKRKPFLDQLIDISQDGVVLTDTEIKEQVDTIMFEGHDTTAAAASFFMCIMGCHPEYQDKCVEELHEIFGDSDRPATFQDTLEMKYLERCILETIRMFPPVPGIARTVTVDCKMASGDYTIPAGATVVVATYGLHHDPKLYPNHNVFNPDNFLPEKAARRHYYSFIPFSAGPRSCVGRKYAMLKLKILLSTILRNYKLTSDIPTEKFRLQADIILKRADGFKVKIEPRKFEKANA